MREWTVSVTWEAPSPVTDEDLDRLMDEVDVVAGEPGQTRLSSTLTVKASNPGDAAAEAFVKVKRGIPGEFVSLEVMTTEEQDRRLDEPAFPELVGVTEISKALGISRQRASALQKSPGFPGPVAVLASGPIYRRADLSRFEETWPRRQGRPPKEASESGIYRSAGGPEVAVSSKRTAAGALKAVRKDAGGTSVLRNKSGASKRVTVR